jgi:hypothetical protein
VDDLTTPIAADPAAVPLGLLRRYLTANKWRHAQMPGTPPVIPEHLRGIAASFIGTPIRQRAYDVYVRSKPGQPDIEIVLPTSREDTTSVEQIESAVMKLAALERSSPESVIAAIRSIGFDRIFSRVPDALVVDDAIHLDIAADHIRGMKAVLTATATTELRPNAYFLRASPMAIEYADHCRFAHTFKGSFGFTIESPVTPNEDPTLPIVEEQPPFERLVVQRFARGVQSVIAAGAAGDTMPITGSISTGFSANACEVFAQMIEDTSPGGLWLSVAFSPEWATPAGLVLPQVEVNARHIEVTRAAAKEMRQKPVSREEVIIGRVTDLHSDNPADLLTSNSNSTVVVVWNSKELGEIPVLVALSPPDYLIAVDAHKAGRAVKAAGTLEQKGRRWVLSFVSEFSLNVENA